MMALLMPDEAGKSYRSVAEAAKFVALLLIEHWEFCNLYTISYNAIVKKVEGLYNRFRELVRWRKGRENSKSHSEKICQLKSETQSLFDILVKDEERRKSLENTIGIKMKKEEFDFYQDQKDNKEGSRKTFYIYQI